MITSHNSGAISSMDNKPNVELYHGQENEIRVSTCSQNLRLFMSERTLLGCSPKERTKQKSLAQVIITSHITNPIKK